MTTVRISIEQWDGLWRTNNGRMSDRWGFRAVHRVPGPNGNTTTMCAHVHRSEIGAYNCATEMLRASIDSADTIDAPAHIWERARLQSPTS